MTALKIATAKNRGSYRIEIGSSKAKLPMMCIDPIAKLGVMPPAIIHGAVVWPPLICTRET